MSRIRWKPVCKSKYFSFWSPLSSKHTYLFIWNHNMFIHTVNIFNLLIFKCYVYSYLKWTQYKIINAYLPTESLNKINSAPEKRLFSNILTHVSSNLFIWMFYKKTVQRVHDEILWGLNAAFKIAQFKTRRNTPTMRKACAPRLIWICMPCKYTHLGRFTATRSLQNLLFIKFFFTTVTTDFLLKRLGKIQFVHSNWPVTLVTILFIKVIFLELAQD